MQCRFHIIDHHGVKIGLIGLVEQEWLATMPLLEHCDVRYLDFVSEGRRLCQVLRNEHKVDMVVALTHMRAPNDLKLGSEVPEIDLILGGHDHHYAVERCHPSRTLLFKSGTDFRELSLIHLKRASPRWEVCYCPAPSLLACRLDNKAEQKLSHMIPCYGDAFQQSRTKEG